MRTIFIAAGLVLAGCATKPGPLVPAHWSRAGTDQATFMQDRYVCLQQAQQGRSAWEASHGSGSGSASVITNGDLYLSCMGAKGYRRDPNGSLAAPAEMGVIVD
jgi:hypothetical protein